MTRETPSPATDLQVYAELSHLRAEVARLQRDSDMLRVVLASRSWRITRPLRFLGRVVRRGGLDASEREVLARVWRRLRMRFTGVDIVPLPPPVGQARAAQDMLALPDLARHRILPAPPLDKPDVYVWAVIDWHFRIQRPQHLARALADAGHRVFYISNNFVDSTEPGFSVDPLDEKRRLFQVHLHLVGAPAIYSHPPTDAQRAQLALGLQELMRWQGGHPAVSIVQHPYWTLLAGRAPVTQVVYDCMDHHAGFADNTSGVLAEERHLIATTDLVVVTSQWLEQEIGRQGRPVALIRNATEFAHFNQRPARVFADPRGRRVIGYYGAIAHWFDTDLVRRVALAFPEDLVLLVGSDTAGAGAALADVPNVEFAGEVKYSELPYWLYGFDVCLLPFKVEPLTLATNPVKVYEYLSAGKPVVSVDLPEMAQFGGCVRVAATPGDFVAEIAHALGRPTTPEETARRESFAARQTWSHRAEELDDALGAMALAKVSVIVVTYNNLEYTKACLDSLERFSDWSNLEIIVVDNASADGSPDHLREWAAAGPMRRVILNDDNRGFSAANNQGLSAATGEYLILLNNDTFVTRGWVRGLLNHLRRDPTIALVGPVTNNIGNEARIDAAYADMHAMAEFASGYTARHAGQSFDIRTLAFFCVAMPRATYERIGPLDEAFGLGFFEDDDYCRRIDEAGMRCVCAEDVFIHHHLSASFDKLKQERRQELFERNKAIYEAKWGPWLPHTYR